jgi:MFS family permease
MSIAPAIAIGDSTAGTVGRRSRLVSIVGGSAGNVIEWFDFLAYSVFSIYFSKAFFPGGDMTAQLLNTAAIAAVGYVVRPLGSWLIGVLADRRGRRVALSSAVAMMSLGSFIIAVTPTYATIGIAAPVVLCWRGCCRASAWAARRVRVRRTCRRWRRRGASANMRRAASASRDCAAARRKPAASNSVRVIATAISPSRIVERQANSSP